jgi:CRP-like cAMP-binding protein
MANMTMQELEHRIATTRRLGALTYPAIRRVARQGRLLNVEAGQIIIGPNFGGTSAYVVFEGSVGVIMPWGPVLEHLGPGEVFGEIALIEGVERTAFCKAETDCLLFEIPFQSFHSDLLGNPTIRAGLEELSLARDAVQRAIRQGVLHVAPVASKEAEDEAERTAEPVPETDAPPAPAEPPPAA